jgi:hypothetical protein
VRWPRALTSAVCAARRWAASSMARHRARQVREAGLNRDRAAPAPQALSRRGAALGTFGKSARTPPAGNAAQYVADRVQAGRAAWGRSAPPRILHSRQDPLGWGAGCQTDWAGVDALRWRTMQARRFERGLVRVHRSMAKWLPDHHINKVNFDSGQDARFRRGCCAGPAACQASSIRSAVAAGQDPWSKPSCRAAGSSAAK